LPNVYLILRPNFIARPSTCHGQHHFTDGFIKGLEERSFNWGFVSLKNNTGFVSANNYVVSQVEDGEWVVFLNSDAFAKLD
jgi:GT2 family glycosyltransferase